MLRITFFLFFKKIENFEKFRKIFGRGVEKSEIYCGKTHFFHFFLESEKNWKFWVRGCFQTFLNFWKSCTHVSDHVSVTRCDHDDTCSLPKKKITHTRARTRARDIIRKIFWARACAHARSEKIIRAHARAHTRELFSDDARARAHTSSRHAHARDVDVRKKFEKIF